MSAFACDPTRGSERAVGWSWAVSAAELHEVVLITGAWNREYVEPHRSRTSLRDVVYVDFPNATVRWLGRHAIGHYLSYIIWQKLASNIARQVDSEYHFDLIHHVTYGATWLPSFMSELGIPVLLGPLGGAERCPAPLLRSLPLSGLLTELVRLTSQRVFHLMPSVRRTLRSASLCLAKTHDSQESLRRHGAPNVSVVSELSVPASLLEDSAAAPRENATSLDRPKFVAVARLEYWKGVHLTVRGFASARRVLPDARLVVVGDGPERARLGRLTRRLRLDDCVEFVQQLPRSEVLRAMSSATALVHPSLHDSSGNVLVEALACGLPIIYLKTGGPAVVVPPGAGLPVEPSTPSATISALGAAMERIATEEGLRARLSEACVSSAERLYGRAALQRRIEREYWAALQTARTDGHPATAEPVA